MSLRPPGSSPGGAKRTLSGCRSRLRPFGAGPASRHSGGSGRIRGSRAWRTCARSGRTLFVLGPSSVGCPGVRAEKPVNGSPAVTCERASDVLVQARLVPWRLGAPDSADNCQTGSSPRRGNAVRRVGKRLATFFGPYLRVAASAKALLSRFYHSLRSSSPGFSRPASAGRGTRRDRSTVSSSLRARCSWRNSSTRRNRLASSGSWAGQC